MLDVKTKQIPAGYIHVANMFKTAEKGVFFRRTLTMGWKFYRVDEDALPLQPREVTKRGKPQPETTQPIDFNGQLHDCMGIYYPSDKIASIKITHIKEPALKL